MILVTLLLSVLSLIQYQANQYTLGSINHIILLIWACSRNRKCLGNKTKTAIQDVAEL